MTCYILKGLCRDNPPFTIALKTIVDWVEDNQDDFSRSIENFQLATSLDHDIFTVLGQ